MPAERVFSASGNIVNNKRNRLKETMVDALVFLNKNEHLLNPAAHPQSCEQVFKSLFDPSVVDAGDDSDEPALPNLACSE